MTKLAVKDMGTIELLASAERQVNLFLRFLGMDDAEKNRGDTKTKGHVPQNTQWAIYLPMMIEFVRELESRGIDTGYDWLVEIFDEEVNDLQNSMS